MSDQGGVLYLWGKCTRNEHDKPLKQPTAHQQLLGQRFLQVVCGRGFTAGITEEQEVFTIGSESWFRAGHDEQQDSIETVRQWKELSGQDVVQLHCGPNFMAALTGEGRVYTWGTGSFGQLGQAQEQLRQFPEMKIDAPMLLQNLLDVDQVACGDDCMAAITKNGKLYTWGKGFSGVLGHGDEQTVYTPQRVHAMEAEMVLQVKCGSSHMACLTESKEIFTWGNNFLGPLGRILGKHKDADCYPRLVELVQRGAQVIEENLLSSQEVEFVQVECLRSNTLALSADGEIFSCGKGGTEGSGHGEQPHTLFCLVESLSKHPVKFMASSSSDHIAVITEDNVVYVWGNGDNYKLGTGSTEGLMHPQVLKALQGREVIGIACGDTHTAAIINEPAPPSAARSNQPISSSGNSRDEGMEEYGSDEEPVMHASPAIVQPKPVEQKPTVAEKHPSSPAPTPAKQHSSPTPAKQPKASPNDVFADFDDAHEDLSDVPKQTCSDDELMGNNSHHKAKHVDSDEELFNKAQPAKQNKSQPAKPVDSDEDDLRPNKRQVPIPAAVEQQMQHQRESSLQAQATATKASSPTATSPAAQQLQLPQLSGYLNKKGEKGVLKLWRKRFFKMEKDTIDYFEKEGGKLNGQIMWRDVMDVLKGSSSVKFSFNLASRTGRVYELQCLTQEEFDNWTSTLKAKLHKK